MAKKKKKKERDEDVFYKVLERQNCWLIKTTPPSSLCYLSFVYILSCVVFTNIGHIIM